MPIPHTRFHWLAITGVLVPLLLALNDAHGQPTGSTGPAAMFEGRPAMAGAQGGLGAQAGPPQGGIGVQGSDDLSRPLRKDIGKPKPSKEVAPPSDSVAPPKDAMSQPRDSSMAKEQRSAAKSGAKAAKRTLRRSRTGVGEIDSRSGEGG